MKKIAIIGLGLIGASLLRALQNKGFELVAISSTLETVKKIQDENLANVATSEMAAVTGCDVVFVCTPISTVRDILCKLSKIVTKETVVTDAASVKGFICEYAKELDMNFIGSHPMAGTENSGFDAAEENLFEGAKWVLTPDDEEKQKDGIALLESVISKTGARTVIMSPDVHDEAVALISHVPMILSQSLFYMISNYEKPHIGEAAKLLASSGFRDMTRLACSNIKMAMDMVEYNKENIFSAVNRFSLYERNLLDNYELSVLEEIVKDRKNMYSKEGKNLY